VGDLGVEQVADEPVQARGEMGAAAVDPTRATSPSLFFSTISCAMRTSVRRMSSSSRTTFCWVIRVLPGLSGPG
jgi:hypothetical protein